jgi:hypothetical protein
MKHRLAALACAIVALGAAPSLALAQSPYVGASLGSDVTRFDGVADVASPGSGEALSWAIKVGTPVASRFGVELEFSRPQEITREDGSDVIPLAASGLGAALASYPNVILPSFNIRTSQRNTTIATTAWVRQQVTPRFSMQYLGGVGFFRINRSYSYEFPKGIVIPTDIASAIFPRSNTSIEYGAGPLVGAEARVGMTEHAWLVPGVRFQGLTDGWVVRPFVGIAWEF